MNYIQLKFFLSFNFFFFFFLVTPRGLWILIPWSGVEPGPSAVTAQIPIHWTTGEFPQF